MTGSFFRPMPVVFVIGVAGDEVSQNTRDIRVDRPPGQITCRGSRQELNLLAHHTNPSGLTGEMSS